MQTRRRSNTGASKIPRIHDYLLGDKIGDGQFSEINAAIHSETYSPAAIKILSKRKIASLPYGESITFSEAVLAPLLVHPHITALLELIETESQIMHVLEFMDNGNLLNFCFSDQIDYHDKIRITDEILSAIEYLHRRNICHRDIKLENVLVSNEHVAKLCDFGFATIANDSISGSYGSYGYAAPEVFVDKPYDGKAADMFSTGVLIYALFNQCLPLEDTQNPDCNAIDFSQLPKGIDEIVKGMLRNDPSERISAEEARKNEVFNNLERRVKNTYMESPFPLKKPDCTIAQRIAELTNSTVEETEQKLLGETVNVEKSLYLLIKEVLQNEGYSFNEKENTISGRKNSSLPTNSLSRFSNLEDYKSSECFQIHDDPAKAMIQLDNYILRKQFSLSTSISGKRTAMFCKNAKQVIMEYEAAPSCAIPCKICGLFQKSECFDITITSKIGGVQEPNFIDFCGYLKNSISSSKL